MPWTRSSIHQRAMAHTGATPAMRTAAIIHQKFPSCRAVTMPARVFGSRNTHQSAKTVTATWSVVMRIFFMRAATNVPAGTRAGKRLSSKK